LDILADIVTRVRLSGTLLFHYELSNPWGLALPALPDGVFHYMSRGSASLAVQKRKDIPMAKAILFSWLAASHISFARIARRKFFHFSTSIDHLRTWGLYVMTAAETRYQQ